MHSGLIVLAMNKYEYEYFIRKRIYERSRNEREESLRIYNQAANELEIANLHHAINNTKPADENAKHALEEADLAIKNAFLEMGDDKIKTLKYAHHLCSFSIKEDLSLKPSPTLPEGFHIHSISIDDRYIYLGGVSEDTDFPWEIRIWERETLVELPKLTGPTLSKDLEVPNEFIQQIFTRNNLIVAVTPLGRLFYWCNFTALPDRSITLTDELMDSGRYIDTVYLNENADRVVMMNLMSGSEAAMVVDNELSLVPADDIAEEDTGQPMDYFIRIDTECQTAVRIKESKHQGQLDAPQLDIYPLSQKEPWFKVQPLSASLNVELGPFIDIWVNKFSLTYFGVNGVVQLRFDQEPMDSSYETTTSSQYVALRRLR